MKFYLFRHGETDWNKVQRIQGSTNTPLNAKGREQAKGLIPLFEELQPEIIFSSDLQRAFDTGSTIANALGIPIKKDQRLREAYFGEAEGMKVSEIKETFGEDIWENFKIMTPEHEDLSFPGGESRRESVKRMRSVIEEIISLGEYKAVGISTHGGVVRNLLHSYLEPGHPPIEIPNCVTYLLEYKEGLFKVKGPLSRA